MASHINNNNKRIYTSREVKPHQEVLFFSQSQKVPKIFKERRLNIAPAVRKNEPQRTNLPSVVGGPQVSPPGYPFSMAGGYPPPGTLPGYPGMPYPYATPYGYGELT